MDVSLDIYLDGVPSPPPSNSYFVVIEIVSETTDCGFFLMHMVYLHSLYLFNWALNTPSYSSFVLPSVMCSVGWGAGNVMMILG